MNDDRPKASFLLKRRSDVSLAHTKLRDPFGHEWSIASAFATDDTEKAD